MFEKLEKINFSSTIKARRALFTFVSIFMLQFAAVQYGTYVAFSWDIMEPITCGMTLGDAILAYFFWIKSG